MCFVCIQSYTHRSAIWYSEIRPSTSTLSIYRVYLFVISRCKYIIIVSMYICIVCTYIASFRLIKTNNQLHTDETDCGQRCLTTNCATLHVTEMDSKVSNG